MTFAAKLRANLDGRNKHFTPDKKSVTGDFSIEHYAGPVPYRCTKFLDKNRDSLSMGACRFLEFACDLIHRPPARSRLSVAGAKATDATHAVPTSHSHDS